MLTAIFIFLAAAILYFQIDLLPGKSSRRVTANKPVPARLVQAMEYAQRLSAEKKYLLAEKAYLQVLKIDHKNATAYTQLGMVYSKLSNYEDAKECFNMAAQIEPSAATYHNLGLVYTESRNTIKAIAAFEKAIIFQPVASRYINLAKAYQKLSNQAKVITCLQKAVELEPTQAHLALLASAYKSAGQLSQSKEIHDQMVKLQVVTAAEDQALSESPPFKPV